MLKRAMDVKLNVKPIFIMFNHKYYYEGPCRMAGGDAIQPNFDLGVNANIIKGVSMGLKYAAPEDAVNIMEPGIVTGTDDWDMKDEYLETLMKDHDQVDAYVVLVLFGADRIWREFCRMCDRPVIVVPNQWNPMKSAYLFNHGVETYIPYDWPEVTQYLRAMRAKKAIAKANILLVQRFSDNMALAGADDSFRSLEEVTDEFGTHFRPVNFHELIEMMEPLPEGGNSTTPGRITDNITEAEIEELEAKADELMAQAEECAISKEYLMNSLKAWKVVNKLMDYYDCSGCAIPCPDTCSSRRLNQCKFTFCLNHQLNHENGVPSACKYDVAATLTMLGMVALSGNVPYQANTLPVTKTGDEYTWIWQVPEEDRDAIEDKDNLYVLNMSPHMRTKKVGGEPEKHNIRHFAYDQKFGAVFHKDFQEDVGETVTFARLSGDCKSLMIVKGEIVRGYGYDLDNCSGGFIFRVSDGKRMYKEQAKFGLMLPVVFGDWADDLAKLGEVMGLETVII